LNLAFTVLNSHPKTRAERAFHLGGAGAPAHASCRVEPILNSFTAPLGQGGTI